MQHAVLGDHCQFADAASISIERQPRCTVITGHQHSVDRRDPGFVHVAPYVTGFEELPACRAEREHALVESGCSALRRFCGTAGVDQRHADTGIGQRDRKRAPNQAATDNGNVNVHPRQSTRVRTCCFAGAFALTRVRGLSNLPNPAGHGTWRISSAVRAAES